MHTKPYFMAAARVGARVGAARGRRRGGGGTVAVKEEGAAAAEASGAAATPTVPGLAGWQALGVGPAELRIDLTLACGQSFRWAPTGASEWTGVVSGRVLTLRQTGAYTHTRTRPTC
jgi:hypothetical protein